MWTDEGELAATTVTGIAVSKTVDEFPAQSEPYSELYEGLRTMRQGGTRLLLVPPEDPAKINHYAIKEGQEVTVEVELIKIVGGSKP